MAAPAWRGVVVPGRGRGVARMDERVLAVVRDLFGLDAVAGTLNVRLPEPLESAQLPAYMPASRLGPTWEQDTGQAGYFYAPGLVEGRFRAVIARADEPGYPADLLELLCEVHLRSTLGLADGDPIRFSVEAP